MKELLIIMLATTSIGCFPINSDISTNVEFPVEDCTSCEPTMEALI